MEQYHKSTLAMLKWCKLVLKLDENLPKQDIFTYINIYSNLNPSFHKLIYNIRLKKGRGFTEQELLLLIFDHKTKKTILKEMLINADYYRLYH